MENEKSIVKGPAREGKTGLPASETPVAYPRRTGLQAASRRSMMPHPDHLEVVMKPVARLSLVVVLLAVAGLLTAAVTYSPLVKVIPGPNLPPEVLPKTSNNNLDLIRFDNRLFLGFRTGPFHFASPYTVLYIMSSTDEGKTWDFEAKVDIGADMREPRFLELNGRLFFYFFEAGKNPFGFTPRHVWAMERVSKGSWTEKQVVYEPACVLWRAKVRNGKAYVSMYCGADKEYVGGNDAIGIQFLTTADGYHFEPVTPGKPVVSTGGSEMDFDFDAAGNLYAVIRNEAGDGKSWQSKVCTAAANDLGNWKCQGSDYKFDSPLAFTHQDNIYVIARLNPDGPYDRKARWMWNPTESLYYLARYWWTPKRTALYLIDKQNLTAQPILEFPSKGDTAFPGLVKIDDNRYLMYNYSSDPNGPDRVWMSGQLHDTNIYSTVITFSE